MAVLVTRVSRGCTVQCLLAVAAAAAIPGDGQAALTASAMVSSKRAGSGTFMGRSFAMARG